MTMIFKQFLERAFGKSSKGSNTAHSGCFEMILCVALFLAVYVTTGAIWASYAGAACIVMAIILGAAAFLSQSVSQLICWLETVRAKKCGEKPRVFKEDDPLCAKLIRKAFNVTAAKAKKATNLFSPTKAVNPVQVSRTNTRIRTNTRAHRRAPRPAFARSSHGGGEGGDDSGDSDQGDPPGPSHHTAPLKLYQSFYRKSNSPSHRRRFLYALRCWRVSCGKRSGGRWAE